MPKVTQDKIIISLPYSDLREAVTRLRSAEVNAVSGVLKLYFRELPEPLIPTEMFHSLAKTLGKKTKCIYTSVKPQNYTVVHLILKFIYIYIYIYIIVIFKLFRVFS